MWGPHTAVRAWLGAILLAGICALGAGRVIDAAGTALLLVGLLWIISFWIGMHFLRNQNSATAKRLETFSAAWSLLLYLGLAAIALTRIVQSV